MTVLKALAKIAGIVIELHSKLAPKYDSQTSYSDVGATKASTTQSDVSGAVKSLKDGATEITSKGIPRIMCEDDAHKSC